MFAQLKLEGVEGISPQVIEEEISQAVIDELLRLQQHGAISPQKSVEIDSQKNPRY